MLINKTGETSHVKFISYDGRYPNLCRGRLCLEIDGKNVWFSDKSIFDEKTGEWVRIDEFPAFWETGGTVSLVGVQSAEWEIDVNLIPEKYKKYAAEINEVFNENVEYGCCGGCL